ncbi:MAG: hypothetical protein HOP16_03030 [Acidobacteria bacterium]|nr:hypothetical protein [Acidobacteriota bacterium]
MGPVRVCPRPVRRKPTLIEWDDDIPAFGTLLGQAAMADAIAAKVLEPEAQRVAAR